MKTNSLTIKKLSIQDLTPILLDNFTRHQKITRIWKYINNSRIIINAPQIESWTLEKKRHLATHHLPECIHSGGAVYFAYHKNTHVGLAAIPGTRFGPQNEYIQLSKFFLIPSARGKGFGRLFFNHIINETRTMQGKKLYISSNPSIETVAFYEAMGAKDAEWISQRLVDEDPTDIYLEFSLLT